MDAGKGYHAPSSSNGAGAGKLPPTVMVQPLRKAEMQPSYAQEMDNSGESHGLYGAFISGLGACIGTLGAVPCCPLPNQFRNVGQGSVGLISRFGKVVRTVDPGLVKVNVCSENLKVVDIKIQLVSVPRQNCVTKDNVSVEIEAVISWHVVQPYRAAFGVADVRNALVERAQTTLRQVVGGRLLQTVITDREGLAAEIQEILEATAETWGVNIESILLKDITFSQELQNLLSSAATQKRIGESKVIAARAEVEAAKLMRQAADILASPAAMQIRQLDALQSMAKNANSKVVFVPMNLNSMGGAGIKDTGAIGEQIQASIQNDAQGVEQGNAMIAGLGESSRSAGMINSMTSL